VVIERRQVAALLTSNEHALHSLVVSHMRTVVRVEKKLSPDSKAVSK
jgi:DNA-directed RNA polymerase sigma subunit (sigma70/sigma32)